MALVVDDLAKKQRVESIKYSKALFSQRYSPLEARDKYLVWTGGVSWGPNSDLFSPSSHFWHVTTTRVSEEG